MHLYLLEQRIPEDSLKSEDSDSLDSHLLDDYIQDFFFYKNNLNLSRFFSRFRIEDL